MLVITIGLYLLAGAHLSPRVHAGALLIFSVTGTILLSMLLYRVIEKPCMRLGKHLSQQSWAQGPAAAQRAETPRVSLPQET
jgi:peptidoglycan/LPS O-acetylase OafA/YrhL